VSLQTVLIRTCSSLHGRIKHALCTFVYPEKVPKAGSTVLNWCCPVAVECC